MPAKTVAKLNEFLTSTSKDALSNKTDSRTFHIVIGNEASDMDSIISSIVYAFYKNVSEGNANNVLSNRISYSLTTKGLRTCNQYSSRRLCFTYRDHMDLLSITNPNPIANLLRKRHHHRSRLPPILRYHSFPSSHQQIQADYA
jgi:hypothetical protein